MVDRLRLVKVLYLIFGLSRVLSLHKNPTVKNDDNLSVARNRSDTCF